MLPSFNKKTKGQGECRASSKSFTSDNSTHVVDELLPCRTSCGTRSFEGLESVSDGTAVVAPSRADEMEIVVVTMGGGNPGDMGGGDLGDCSPTAVVLYGCL